MNNPLGVSPSKGNQGTTKKSFDVGGNRTHDLRIRSTVIIIKFIIKSSKRLLTMKNEHRLQIAS